MSSVIGIGQCSLDYLAFVDTYPPPDTKKEVSQWVEQGGGPVATALVTLSRLGIPCKFYGVIGDDGEGEKIKQSLITEGIDISNLKVRENARSQVAFIVIEKDGGRRTIFWRRPSGRELSIEELNEGFLDDALFLHLDGLMAEVSIYAARVAKKHNIPVMVDAGRLRPGMLELAKEADFFVASEEFATDMGWDGTPEGFITKAKELCAPVVTVTLGHRGSITWYKDEIIEIPAFKVDVVDTTGAGDVFHGGYIYGILQGWDIKKTLQFATAVAAMKCREPGGRKGIPTLDEAMEFLRWNSTK
jgi:ribokinase